MNTIKDKELKAQLRAIEETTRKATISKESAIDYLQRAGFIEKQHVKPGKSAYAESPTHKHTRVS